ncbi:MAG TPA: ImmA/IrrE family metallo-endopeptidase [Acidimicrobiales bacterium]
MKVAFHADPDDGRSVDDDTAASWGALQIWVDGVNLCSHVDQGETLQATHWYLLPVLEWLARSWDPLLHEERLPAPSFRFTNAAALANEPPKLQYAETGGSEAFAADQWRFDWEQRHSLRAARDGGILPEVRLRRLRDEIEISWMNLPLAGAETVEFTATEGHSVKPPDVVADVLYDVLVEAAGWLRAQRPDSGRIEELVATVAALRSLDRSEVRTAWVAGLGGARSDAVDSWRSVVGRVREEFAGGAAFAATFEAPSEGELVLAGSCEAALLFGSVSPTLGEDDVFQLTNLLLRAYDPAAKDPLADLVEHVSLDPATPAWEQGYELADQVLDHLRQAILGDRVHIEDFLQDRAVRQTTVVLSDGSIRAVSFAGPDHTPTIALNTWSRFIASPGARRFTLAHELCHLLFDRSMGARLAVASGPWAPAAIERRANAFAAMLLMPPALLGPAVTESGDRLRSPESAKGVAERLGVTVSALVEHAHNLGFIDETVREVLRADLYLAR